jgi:hypothetical protein
MIMAKEIRLSSEIPVNSNFKENTDLHGYKLV